MLYEDIIYIRRHIGNYKLKLHSNSSKWCNLKLDNIFTCFFNIKTKTGKIWKLKVFIGGEMIDCSKEEKIKTIVISESKGAA